MYIFFSNIEVAGGDSLCYKTSYSQVIIITEFSNSFRKQVPERLKVDITIMNTFLQRKANIYDPLYPERKNTRYTSHQKLWPCLWKLEKLTALKPAAVKTLGLRNVIVKLVTWQTEMI